MTMAAILEIKMAAKIMKFQNYFSYFSYFKLIFVDTSQKISLMT